MADSIRETKPSDGRADARPVSRDKTGLILAAGLVIFIAFAYKILSGLSSELNALQKEHVNLGVTVKQLNDKVSELKAQLDDQSKDKEMVAFSARLNPSYTDIEPWATIIFADIVTNVGNSYCGKSGEFTAPVKGLYAFFGHILTKEGENSIETALAVNGHTKLLLYAGGTRSSHGSGANLLVVNLQKGDKVKMVKHGPLGTKPFYIHRVWSTFSGFLLRAES